MTALYPCIAGLRRARRRRAAGLPSAVECAALALEGEMPARRLPLSLLQLHHAAAAGLCMDVATRAGRSGAAALGSDERAGSD